MVKSIINLIHNDEFNILVITDDFESFKTSLDKLDIGCFHIHYLNYKDSKIEKIKDYDPNLLILDLVTDFDAEHFLEQSAKNFSNVSLILLAEESAISTVDKFINLPNIRIMKKPVPYDLLFDQIEFFRSLLASYKAKIDDKSNDLINLINNLNDIFFEVDLNGNFLFLSTAIKRITGYESAELIGSHFSKLIHPNDITIFKLCFELSKDEKNIKPTEIRLVHKNSSVLTVLTSGSGVIYRRNEPYCFSGIFTNISRQKEIEQELLASREHYAAISNSIPDLIFRHNKEGVITDYHSKVNDQLILPPDKVIGTTLEDLPFSTEDREVVRNAISEAVALHEVKTSTYSFDIEGKKAYFEARYSPISSDEVIALVRDITEQKTLEVELTQSEHNYRSLVENSRTIILRIDKNARLIFINKYGLEFFGYSLEELTCDRLDNIIIPKNKNSISSISIDDVIKYPAQYYQNENENMKKNGDTAWISWTNTPIYDSQGNFMEILCIGVDRTKQRSAEKELMDSYLLSKKYQAAISKVYIINSCNIHDTLKKIISVAADALEVERVSFWDFNNEADAFLTCRILYERSRDEFSEGYQLGKDLLSDYFDRFSSNRLAVVPDVLNYPPLAKIRDYLVQSGISSTMDVLIRLSDRNIGVVCIEHLGEIRNWTIQEEDFVLAISDRISIELEAFERRAALEEKNKTEQRFRTFIENANDIVLSTDLNLIITYISPNVLQKLGFHDEDFIGKSISEYIYKDDIREVTAYINGVINGSSLSDYYLQYRILNKNGKLLWFRASASCIRNQYNEPEYLIAYTSDITSIVKAEESLKENRKILQSIFDTVTVGILLLDSNGIINSVNKKGTEIFGYLTNEILGYHFSKFLPEYVQSIGNNVFSKIMHEGGEYSGETVYKRKSGATRYLSIDLDFLVKDDGGKFILAVFSDISDRKKSEEQLKKSKEQAEIANKMKSEFLANVSHEIRTPLNSIIGFAHLLIDSGASEKQKNYLNSIKNSGKNLLSMINDIIDLSKIESGKLVAVKNMVNIYELLDSTFDSFKNKAKEKNLNLIMHIDGSVPLHIKTDEKRIQQILSNLIDNSIKYTESGYVKILLHQNNIEFADRTIDLSVQVEDTGIGIDPKIINSLFVPFAKQQNNVQNTSSGFGTGLALVKNLAGMLNYEVDFKQNDPQGSIFTLSMKEVFFGVGFDIAHKVKRENIVKSINPIAVTYISDDKQDLLISTNLENLQFDLYIARDFEDLVAKVSRLIPNIIIISATYFSMIMKFLIEMKLQFSSFKIPIIIVGDANNEGLIFNGKIIPDLESEDGLNNTLKDYLPDVFIKNKSFQEINILNFSDELNTLDEIIFIRLKNTIESKFINEWQIVCKSSILNDIKAFAENLLQVGNNFELSLLAQYSQKLINQTNDFDFGNLPITLNEFGYFIEAINNKNIKENL